MLIRTISSEDNTAIATIIRDALMEHKAAKPGTVYFDTDTDRLSEVFDEVDHPYFVATVDGVVAGGAGIFPTKGLDSGTCELVKMYLHPDARGRGYASLLIDTCIDAAKEKGYQKIYLESLPELSKALKIYEKKGWTYLPSRLGASCHSACNLWMIKEI